MGRIAKAIAIAGVNANNLSPTEELPDVSLWDVFFPRTAKKMLNTMLRAVEEVSMRGGNMVLFQQWHQARSKQ
jgi:hypothetical protein